MTRTTDPLLRPATLRLWQRFHFRLTLVDGGVVLLMLSAMGGIFYWRALDAELRVLQGRLRAAAVSLASGVAPASVDTVVKGGEPGDAAYRSLVARFKTVCDAEPEIASIYLLRPTEQPGMLAFVADHVAHGNVPPAAVGRRYDATRAQRELEAFHGPVVESQPYTDEWGTVLSGDAPVRAAGGEAVAIVSVDVFASRLAEMRTPGAHRDAHPLRGRGAARRRALVDRRAQRAPPAIAHHRGHLVGRRGQLHRTRRDGSTGRVRHPRPPVRRHGRRPQRARLRAIVAGREEPTELCEVLDPADPRAARLPFWERAMEHYFARRFEEAIACFEEATAGLDDPAVAHQLARCRKLVMPPPEPSWTGVARLAKQGHPTPLGRLDSPSSSMTCEESCPAVVGA